MIFTLYTNRLHMSFLFSQIFPWLCKENHPQNFLILQVNFSQTEIQMGFDFQASGFDLPDSIFYDALMMMTEFSHACHIFMHVLCDNCRRGGWKSSANPAQPFHKIIVNDIRVMLSCVRGKSFWSDKYWLTTDSL